MSDNKAQLKGRRVLVTRPSGQAKRFSESIQLAGGEAVGFPVIAIEPIAPLSPRVDFKAIDACIFVSSNAVEFGASYLKNIQSVCIAVGSKTASSLRQQGVGNLLEPSQGFTSEDVLALPELQDVSGQTILIFRGDGGREKLADELKHRGARVEYMEVYRRILPSYCTDDVLTALEVDIAAITSVEGLENLRVIVGESRIKQLINIPLVVGSKRILTMARKYGFQNELVLADNPTDNSMFAALKQWADTRGA